MCEIALAESISALCRRAVGVNPASVSDGGRLRRPTWTAPTGHVDVDVDMARGQGKELLTKTRVKGYVWRRTERVCDLQLGSILCVYGCITAIATWLLSTDLHVLKHGLTRTYTDLHGKHGLTRTTRKTRTYTDLHGLTRTYTDLHGLTRTCTKVCMDSHRDS